MTTPDRHNGLLYGVSDPFLSERERCALVADKRVERLRQIIDIKRQKHRPQNEIEAVEWCIRVAEEIAAGIRALPEAAE